MNYILRLIGNFFDGLGAAIVAMDSTQWGILAGIMVFVGFMALRSRI